MHNTGYEQGFGTIYTAIYHPAEGRAEYRWPGYAWDQSLDDFSPGSRTVRLPSSNASSD